MVGPHGDEEDVEVPLVRYQCKPVSDFGNTIRNKTIIKNNKCSPSYEESSNSHKIKLIIILTFLYVTKAELIAVC